MRMVSPLEEAYGSRDTFLREVNFPRQLLPVLFRSPSKDTVYLPFSVLIATIMGTSARSSLLSYLNLFRLISD